MKYAPRSILRAPGSALAQTWGLGRRARGRTRALLVMGVVGALLTTILGLRLHVNLSPSAPRGLYRTVAGTPARGAWVVACVGPDAAALARARGYLRPGPCPGGVQPVLKPVVAVAGDVVELGPEAVIVNGEHLPASPSAVVDSIGHPLLHTAWGRHVVGAGEVWVVSTRVPNSWDSRYVGPIPVSQVMAVARPVWTVD